MSTACTVVVGTDGTPTADKAFLTALEMAASKGATLHVVSVTPPPPAIVDPSAAGIATVVESGLEAAHESAFATLASCRSRAEAAGVMVETHSIDGDPATGLVALCEKLGADDLVVGNRGMKGLRGLFPSVPSRVLKKAPCTVHVVSTS